MLGGFHKCLEYNRESVPCCGSALREGGVGLGLFKP